MADFTPFSAPITTGPGIEAEKPYSELQGLETTVPSPLDVVGANMEQAWRFNPTPSLFRWAGRQFGDQGKLLPPDEANAKYGVEAYGKKELTFGEPVYEEVAKAKRELKMQELANRRLIQAAQGGFFENSASFILSFLTSAADPINLLSAFVPVVGEARYMEALKSASGVLGRMAVRARFGAMEGAVGAALVEPIVYGVARSEQADYNIYDSLGNIMFGAFLGGGLHATFGAAGDRLGISGFARDQARIEAARAELLRRSSEGQSWLDLPEGPPGTYWHAVDQTREAQHAQPWTAWQRAIDELPLEAKETALRIAVADMIQHGEVRNADAALAVSFKPEDGMVRLFRAEADIGRPGEKPKMDNVPEWVKQGLEIKGADEAAGRWFTADPSHLDFYKNDIGPNHRIVYVDVPKSELDRYRVSNIEAAKRFSRDPENEFFVSRTLASQAQRLPAERFAGNIAPANEALIRRLTEPPQRVDADVRSVAEMPATPERQASGPIEAGEKGPLTKAVEADPTFKRAMDQLEGLSKIDEAAGAGTVGAEVQAREDRFQQELANARKEVAGEAKPTAAPKKEGVSLVTFIRDKGGIKDDRGELKAMDLNKRFPGIVNNRKGLTLDYMREAAEEAGYLRSHDANQTTSVADFLDLLDRTSRGESIYPHGETARMGERGAGDAFLVNHGEEVAVARAHSRAYDLPEPDVDGMREIVKAAGARREGETLAAWQERVRNAVDDWAERKLTSDADELPRYAGDQSEQDFNRAFDLTDELDQEGGLRGQPGGEPAAAPAGAREGEANRGGLEGLVAETQQAEGRLTPEDRAKLAELDNLIARADAEAKAWDIAAACAAGGGA